MKLIPLYQPCSMHETKESIARCWLDEGEKVRAQVWGERIISSKGFLGFSNLSLPPFPSLRPSKQTADIERDAVTHP